MWFFNPLFLPYVLSSYGALKDITVKLINVPVKGLMIEDEGEFNCGSDHNLLWVDTEWKDRKTESEATPEHRT